MAEISRGGYKFHELRSRRHMTQRDIEKATNGAIPAQQVSRIETGAVAEPSMKDLVTLGSVFHLTPNDVAEMYGYWRPAKTKQRHEDPRLLRLLDVLPTLPEPFQEKLLTWLEFSVHLIEAEATGHIARVYEKEAEDAAFWTRFEQIQQEAIRRREQRTEHTEEFPPEE